MNDDSNNNGNPPDTDGWVNPYSATEAHHAVGDEPPGAGASPPSDPNAPPDPNAGSSPSPGAPPLGNGPRLSSQQGPQLRPASSQHHAQQSHQDLPIARTPDPYDVDAGKGMALLAHGSLLTGLPLFIVPMLQKDNAFALHHAKAAGATYLVMLISAVAVAIATAVTCGLAAPLIFLLFLIYVPVVVGIVKAINGETAGSWGFGPMGESIFKGVQIEQTRQIEDDRL